MKKICVGLFAAALVLLCACGGSAGAPSDQPGETAVPGSPAKEPSAPVGAAAEGWRKPDAGEPFGPYRSVGELLDIIENGEPEEAAVYAEPPAPDGAAEDYAVLSAPGEDENAAPDIAYALTESSVAFSTAPWEDKDVEFLDLDALEAEQAAAEGGESVTSGTGWAGSALTKGLPAPTGLSQAYEESGAFTGMATLDSDGYAAYLDDVKAAGFTVGAAEDETSAFGMKMCSYSAGHADGRSILLTLTSGMLIIEITQ